MLYDKEFLLKLDKSKNKTIYARITSLRFDEAPIEAIEGRVTGGSINLDGASALRRSCSLSMTAEKFNHSSYSWGLNTKFKLEIGVENKIDDSYPAVIWFKQGTYLITSFSTSNSTNNFTVFISGKDKMCLLNGELGGNLESSVDFGTIEEESADGIWTIRKIPIPEIIRNLVHVYGKEPYYNIIINDLDTYGLELLEYRYEIPMYLYKSPSETVYKNTILENPITLVKWYDSSGIEKRTTLAEVDSTHLEKLIDGLGTIEPKHVWIDDTEYILTKLQYGETAGYRMTDLTYAGDLIANIGESITSVLDKIRNMLVEFEYFYDVDGRFVFQKKSSYVNTLWGGTSEISSDGEPEYRQARELSAAHSYTFSGGELITAFNNSPQLTNLKNDYSIWGERIGISGAKIPVHMRYAIDVKPTYYKNFDGKVFMTDKTKVEQLKAEMKEQLKYEFYEKINRFTMTYGSGELPAPQKLDDGSWTAGWWDIRDWYEYYKILTDESPNYTMKWYSRNDESGCVKGDTLSITYTSTAYKNGYVWLLIRNKDGRYNGQHGSGTPGTNYRNCILYESSYRENGTILTQKVLDENGNTITKRFMAPYSGCSDDHTYLEFLEGDVKRSGNTVYFYNPDFPSYESYGDLVNERIEEMFREYEEQGLLNYVDWREVIYQMSKDYYKHNQEDDFEQKLIENNDEYYPTGQTGYESYYIDIQGFWRQLYNPEIDKKLAVITSTLGSNTTNAQTGLYKSYIDAKNEAAATKTTKDTVEQVLLNTPEDPEDEYMAAYNAYQEAKKTYDIANNKVSKLEEQIADLENQLADWQEKRENFNTNHWVNAVTEAPETLNFWFDFLDTEGELSQFSVRKIGARPKAINDTNVKSIYFRDTPDVLFYATGESIPIDMPYTCIQAPEEMFSISAQGKSAKDKLDELIYQHGYCIESASITAIPIYYLEPNTRIYVYDQKTGIDGDYIVSKITLPLAYNGTMSITATKAAETVR